MTRTASIDRKTGETDVSLALVLSGSGAGTRATGVGFFDSPPSTSPLTTGSALLVSY